MPFILPEKYFFNHEYCFFLHDLMVNMIKEGESIGCFEVVLKPNKREKKELMNLSGVELFNWMKANGYENELYSLTFKQIYAATLSDCLQYIFNSLKCSERGQLSVAYTLLRKPLKDNLYILELLYSNPRKFITNFDSVNSCKEIAIEKQSKETKMAVIDDVLSKIPYNLFTKEFIYDLRYSKKSDYGFEELWQKSMHIVTNCKHYQTEPGNLNFIFSDEASKHMQWEHLYSYLPFLLMYTYQICFSIYQEIISTINLRNCEAWDRVILGLIYSVRIFHADSFLKVFCKLLDELKLSCQICGEQIEYSGELEKQIVTSKKFTCSKKHENSFF